MTASRPIAVVTTTIPITLSTFHRELIRQVGQTYEVHVVSSPGRHLELLAREMDVTVHPLPMARDISVIADLRALGSWLRLVRVLRPSLVVTATPKASLLGQISAWLLRVPDRLYYLGGLRLEGARGGRRRLLTVMERITSAAATVVVANSPSLYRRYRDLGLAPSRKLHATSPASSHGVDSTHFTPRPPDLQLSRSLGLDSARPVVGFVGRLTHDKGIDDLVAAATTLHERRPGIQWLIVGDQDESDSARYVEELRAVSEGLVIVDAVDDVRPYMALMTLHVLPSLREGFPNVVLEASAMGLPTITTDATGAVDSVRHNDTGLLVPARDPESLADAVERLLDDPEMSRSMGQRAREWVVAEFKPETVVNSLLAPVIDSTRRMRINHVINNLGPGGAERMVVELAHLAQREGHVVTILTLSDSPPDSPPLLRATELGLTVHQTGFHRFDPLGMVKVIRAMWSAEITHAHLFPAFYVAALGPGPKVVTEHSTHNRRRGNWIMRRLDRWVFARYDSVVAISDGVAVEVRKYLAALGVDKPVVTIDNGVPLEVYSTPGPSQRAARELRLLAVGTLDSRKDFRAAIDAVQGIADVTLTIVGDGPERAMLQRAVHTNHQGGQVSFLGRRPDVASLMRSHDALVMTSRYEGFGLVAVEAMASHLPVLATNVSGLSGVVGDGGLVHQPGDLATLRRHIMALRDDEPRRRRLGRTAAQRSRSFSIARTHAQHLTLYNMMLSAARRTRRAPS